MIMTLKEKKRKFKPRINLNQIAHYQTRTDILHDSLFCRGLIQQLMNEAEYLMKNYGDRGGC